MRCIACFTIVFVADAACRTDAEVEAWANQMLAKYSSACANSTMNDVLPCDSAESKCTLSMKDITMTFTCTGSDCNKGSDSAPVDPSSQEICVSKVCENAADLANKAAIMGDYIGMVTCRTLQATMESVLPENHDASLDMDLSYTTNVKCPGADSGWVAHDRTYEPEDVSGALVFSSTPAMMALIALILQYS